MTTTEARTAATGESDAEKAAIGMLTQRFVAAWAYQDGEAVGALFVEEGSMILPGVYCKGRAAVARYMTEAYAGTYKGTQVTGSPIDIRFLAPGVALLLTMGGVLEQGQTEVTTESAIRASWLVVKRDGQWLLAAYQNSPRD